MNNSYKYKNKSTNEEEKEKKNLWKNNTTINLNEFKYKQDSSLAPILTEWSGCMTGEIKLDNKKPTKSF